MYRITDTFLLSDDRDMIEVWRVYQKKWNEKIGAMEVWCTHIQPSVVDRVAKSEAMGYEHGQYPFIELPLERTSRPLIEARGVPELVATQQSEIKVQRDYRSDRASLTILPPLKVPANRGKMEIVLGPAKQLPERRPGEFQWMAPPVNDMGTIEIEAATRRDVDEYFGIPRADMAPQRALLAQQDLVERQQGPVARNGSGSRFCAPHRNPSTHYINLGLRAGRPGTCDTHEHHRVIRRLYACECARTR
jgi:hypothetical protein